MATITETTSALTEEELQVQDWRFEQCLRFGYRTADALQIACADGVDLEQARKLRVLGCPSDLALRILL